MDKFKISVITLKLLRINLQTLDHWLNLTLFLVCWDHPIYLFLCSHKSTHSLANALSLSFGIPIWLFPSLWAPMIIRDSHQNSRLHTGARANFVLLTYLLLIRSNKSKIILFCFSYPWIFCASESAMDRLIYLCTEVSLISFVDWTMIHTNLWFFIIIVSGWIQEELRQWR